MDLAVALVQTGESLGGCSLVGIRNKDLFKMHGRINSVHFVGQMPGNEIDSVDILLVVAALDENGIQIVVNIFFELLKILLLNTAETVMDVLESEDLRHIKIQVAEWADDLERIHHSGMLRGQLLPLGFQIFGFLLDPADRGNSGFRIHVPGSDLPGIGQLFVEAVDGIQSLPVRVDLQKRRQIGDLGEFGQSIFQMDLIFGKISLCHPVNIRFRPGDA